ncbi:pyridoxal-phosphate dependent enzyme family protein, partial [Bacteroides fragilis str. J-143-4]
ARSTGEEIWQDTDGEVAVFVAGVGTGGTVCGGARALKKHNPNVYIVAVEPASSPVLEGGKAASHRIQGIGANFVPGIYDASVVDEVMPVPDDEAIRGGRELASTEGLLVGISSGAAVYAARQLAGRPEFKGKMIVTLLPDTGERYLTTELFAFDAYPLD